jgi:hypothetical protein
MAKGTVRAAIRELLATQSIEYVLGHFKVNAKGQQEGYHYLSTQWHDGASHVVGGDSKVPIIWPKPKWS